MFLDLKSEGNNFYYLAVDVSFQISFLAEHITSLDKNNCTQKSSDDINL